MASTSPLLALPEVLLLILEQVGTVNFQNYKGDNYTALSFGLLLARKREIMLKRMQCSSRSILLPDGGIPRLDGY